LPMDPLEIAATSAGGLIVAVIGAILGAWIWERLIRLRVVNLALYGVLDFDLHEDVVFVFPTRQPAEKRKFDQIAWEDARAIDYVLRALALRRWPMDRIGMRGASHFDPHRDWNKNLVIICSPKSNVICKAALDQLAGARAPKCRFGFNEAERPEDWEIVFDDFSAPSPSHEEEGQGKNELTDYALLAKITNPRNPHAKILFVSGIRAFGTWGAAKYLLEHADDLHDLCRDRDFAVVVRVVYDVEGWRIHHVERTHHGTCLD